MKEIFVTGGTGYLGIPFIEKLCAEGFRVKAVTRAQSAGKIPEGCDAIIGDVLNSQTYRGQIPSGSTFVHMVGAPHPAPWKAAQFQSIDFVSLEQSVEAAKQAAVAHFVFVSVAHPAPVMKAYTAVRARCEQILRKSDLNATILRPWYILGPGHRWPYILLPFYKILETIPSTSESAIRLGLVTRQQMIDALVWAVHSNPSEFESLKRPRSGPRIRTGLGHEMI